MASINISLPDPMKDWVETQARSGRYDDAGAYVRDLIRHDQHRASKISAMQRLVDEALKGGASDKSLDDIWAKGESTRDPWRLNFHWPQRMICWEFFSTASKNTDWRRPNATKASLKRPFRPYLIIPRLPVCGQKITPPVRVYPVQKHMIVYTILEDGQTVYVLRVRHHSENWTEQPIE